MTVPSSRRCSLTTGRGVKALLIKRSCWTATLISPARVRIISSARLYKIVDINQLAPDLLVSRFAQGVHAQKELDASALVFDMRERHLALAVQAADAAGDRHLDRLGNRRVVWLSVTPALPALETPRRHRRCDGCAACAPDTTQYALRMQPLGLIQPLKFQFRRLPHNAAELLGILHTAKARNEPTASPAAPDFPALGS